MAVQFILGRSGTGKTSYCIKAIVNALAEPGEQRLILLVPEQATSRSNCAIRLIDPAYLPLPIAAVETAKNTMRVILIRLSIMCWSSYR
jgi:RecA/RadA recombinase